VLFEARLRDGIHDGSITVIFRRWRQRQVVPGGRYRTRLEMIEVEAVDVVDPARISAADARRGLDEADPRDVLSSTDRLASDDVAEIDRRLDRLDRASSRGPWTTDTLAVIAARPDVRAPDLAASFGLETAVFKRDVRKLKALGLTLSEPVGYRLSPRGRAYLDLRSDARARKSSEPGALRDRQRP
jgi:hypothetical protein